MSRKTKRVVCRASWYKVFSTSFERSSFSTPTPVFDNDGDSLLSVRMQPDTRPVLQQVLSGRKISAILVAVVIVCLVFLRFIPVHRIEAYYWHVRHGNSVEVGGYRFPVPKQWYVDSYSTNGVMLVDLNTGDGIRVRTSSVSDRFTLASWEALMSPPMADGSTNILGRKELQVSGERILCVETNLDTKAVRLYPIQCRSETALEVTFQPCIFSGKDHDPMFYSLLQQIQKP
jgi:hypothetical protein